MYFMQQNEGKREIKDNNIIDSGVGNWRHNDNIDRDGEYCEWTSFMETQQWYGGHMICFEDAGLKYVLDSRKDSQ